MENTSHLKSLVKAIEARPNYKSHFVLNAGGIGMSEVIIVKTKSNEYYEYNNGTWTNITINRVVAAFTNYWFASYCEAFIK